MKKLIIRIVGALVLLLIVALVMVFFSLNSLVKKGVETVGPKLTKVEMKLNSAKLSPLSGNGQLNGLFIGNPEGYKTPSAIKVGDIKVGLQPSSVLSDTIVVDAIHIQAPEITLEGSITGNNLSKILENLNAAAGGDKTAKPEKTDQKSEKKFVVKDVLIQAGKVNLSVTALGGQALTVPLPEIHLQNIGSQGKGVTAAELSKQILEAVLANVMKVSTEAAANVGKNVKDLGKGTVDEVGKAAKGIKDLFKK